MVLPMPLGHVPRLDRMLDGQVSLASQPLRKHFLTGTISSSGTLTINKIRRR
jgi:hypothetical protein